MSEAVGRRFSALARDVTGRGAEALEARLPTPDELAALGGEEQQAVLESLRVELYAVTAVIADATVRRGRRDRDSYAPYGLARSMYSELRAVVANPEPYREGSVDSFHTLGRAYVDTMVLHLDRELNEQRATQPWIVRRLEHLLSLFRLRAGPLTRPRMRDAFSFVYGGLHFGVGVCVQLAEVMARLLRPAPAVPVDERVEVMARSSRPALQLAALNIDQVVVAHQRLQAPQLPAPPGSPPGGQSWMDPARFHVQWSGDRPWRIELAEDALSGGPPGRHLDEMRLTYPTQGCPARVSPAGGSSAIATLWSWTVELARDTGLLGEVDGAATGGEGGGEPGGGTV